MSDIKIFVTHTPNRDTMRVNNSLLYNVIAGSDFQTKEVPEGVYQDNQGDNISSLNKSYCELTTQYWAWKICRQIIMDSVITAVFFLSVKRNLKRHPGERSNTIILIKKQWMNSPLTKKICRLTLKNMTS